MTDSQAINSSVLAEYLDVLKQMQKSLQAHAVHTEYKSTQAYLARAMDTQLSSLIPNCDALRALVAEQEQASATVEPCNVHVFTASECPKCQQWRNHTANLTLIAKGQA